VSSPEIDPVSPARTDNRLLAARGEFANAFGNLARGKRNWQIVAAWALAALSVLLASYVHLAEATRVVPYVVAVDRAGEVLAVNEIRESTVAGGPLIAAQLAAFLRSVRSVLPAEPPQLEADVMHRAYAFVEQGSAAATTLNGYFADPAHDPRILGSRSIRTIDVTSVLPVPNSTAWKLRWDEAEVPIAPGTPSRTSEWEGYVTVHLHPPRSADAIQDNPLGVFITSIVWTRITDVHPQIAVGETR
jgi:type IV secretion system protein TrbF